MLKLKDFEQIQLNKIFCRMMYGLAVSVRTFVKY